MAIKCEMCGSPDLVKDGEYFECKHCGCKYTVAEIKKQMGVVTVSVDQNDKKDSLMKKANTEFDAADFSKALESYNKVLEIDPEEPVALCRAALADAISSSIVELYSHDKIIEYYVRADTSLSSDNYPDYPYEETTKMLSQELVRYILVLGNFIHDQYLAPRGSLTSVEAGAMNGAISLFNDLTSYVKYGYCVDYWPETEVVEDLISVQRAEITVWQDRLKPLWFADFVDQYGNPTNENYYAISDKNAKKQIEEQIVIMKKELQANEEFLEASASLDSYEGDMDAYYQELKEKTEKAEQELKKINDDIAKKDFIISQSKGALFGEKAKAKKQAEQERRELFGKKSRIIQQYDKDKAMVRALSARLDNVE